MKTYDVLLILLLLPFMSFGQAYFVNSGARINISSGTQFNAVNSNFHNLNTTDDIVNDGDITISDGDLLNNGGITGNVKLSGAGVANTTLGSLENLEVDVTSSVTNTGSGSISRYLKLTNGNLDANGQQITLLADANQTCLVHNVNGTSSGDFIVEQFITDGPYSNLFYSSPTANSTIADIADDCNVTLTGNANSFWYDESTASWVAPTSLAYPLTPGKGFYQYTWIHPWGKVFDFTGSLNNGAISAPISNNPAGGGWNIVGNPYPSPIDLNAVYDSGNNPPVTYRYSSGGYFAYNAVVGLSSNVNFGNIVPLMQGFWVHEGNGSVIDPTFGPMDFRNDMRVTDPNTTPDEVAKSAFPIFRLALESESDIVNSVVYFHNDATEEYDYQYDAFYLHGDKPIQFATKTTDKELSINAMPNVDLSSITIPLYTEISVIGNYSISLTEFTDFPSGSKLLLQDLLLSTSHDLTKGEYTYLGNPVEGNDRFVITLLSNTVNTDLVEDNNLFDVYKCGEGLCLSLPKALNDNQGLRIYNVLGQDIYTSILQKGEQFFNLNNVNLPEGNVYFVDVEGYAKASKIVW
ncbi:MAG: hypothetical protein MK207_00705 [Saprospiraceae bacterium]|nr:hypothetical protein [Saprospiraceae bacterium]